MSCLCASQVQTAQRRLSKRTHSHTQSGRVPPKQPVKTCDGWDGARAGAPDQETDIPTVIAPFRVLQQQNTPERNSSSIAEFVLVVHRSSVWLISGEGCGIEGQSPPSQLHAAVHQLSCLSRWLLSRRRAHPLLPVPARHRRH